MSKQCPKCKTENFNCGSRDTENVFYQSPECQKREKENLIAENSRLQAIVDGLKNCDQFDLTLDVEWVASEFKKDEMERFCPCCIRSGSQLHVDSIHYACGTEVDGYGEIDQSYQCTRLQRDMYYWVVRGRNQRIGELQAIVDTLPKGGDGELLQNGKKMFFYCVIDEKTITCLVETVNSLLNPDSSEVSLNCDGDCVQWWISHKDLFSTAEACEKARAK